MNSAMQRFLAVGLFLALLGSCGGSSDSPTAPPGTGILSIYLTDAPVDEVSELNVYICGLTIKPSGAPVERIANDVGLIDLLTLQNGLILLVQAGVPPGTYQFIMVELDEDRSYVIEKATGAEMPLKIPSEEVKVLGGITVDPDVPTNVVLDFDAEKSLKKLGNGQWLLTPVIMRVQ